MLVLKGLHACTSNMAFKLWVIYCTFIAVCVCSLGEEADNLSEGEQVKGNRLSDQGISQCCE